MNPTNRRFYPLALALLALLLPAARVGAHLDRDSPAAHAEAKSGNLPRPPRYFYDESGLVSAPVAAALNERLAEAERRTSNQIIVCIYPGPPPAEEGLLDQFTHTLARTWKVGQEGKDNGIVLFAFLDSRTGTLHGKTRMEVGRGLEGAVPDAVAGRIQREILTPALKRRDFDGGFTAVVVRLIELTAPEFKGTGKTVAEQKRWTGFGPNEYALPIALSVAGLFGVIGIFAYRAARRREAEEEADDLRAAERRRSERLDSSRSAIPATSAPSPSPARHREEYYPVYVPTSTPSVDYSSPSPSPSVSDSPAPSSSFDGGGGDFGGGGAGDSF